MKKYEFQIDRYQRLYIEVSKTIDIWLQRRTTIGGNWLNEEKIAQINYKNVLWTEKAEEIEE